MLRKLRKIEKGSVLLTALIFMFLFSLLGWYLVYTTLTLTNQNQRVGENKKAYYLADAGIQKASERLWDKFVAIGMVPNKTALFAADVNSAYSDFTGTGKLYIDKTTLGDSGTYEAYIQLKTLDPYSAVVTIYATGQTVPNQSGKYAEKKIEADYRYYLSGTPLADFSYFTNNYGYMKGAQAGGSLATNGFFYYEDNIKIAGGDRYKGCKNFEPTNKIDDGGLYAAKGIVSIDGTTVNGFGDIRPSPPDEKENCEFSGITMPSLAELNFYESSAKGSEDQAEASSKKYGIYVWASAGDTILDSSGNPDITFGGGDGILDAGEYIKVSDAVYGDNTSTYTGKSSYYKDSANTWKPGEKENLVVTNTDSSHPIEIYGVVTVKGNVVIQGTIKGTGSVYAGKNIYSPDGLSYSRQPDTFRGFTGSKDGSNVEDTSAQLETVRGNQETWLTANQPGPADDGAKKDLVGLFARENIIVGNAVEVPYNGGAIDFNTSGTIVDALVNRTGNIKVDDGGTLVNESVNFNETDEALLGTDKVPNTRTVKSTDLKSEYKTETVANQWDVEFYTSDNPPPTGGVNPSTGAAMEVLSGSPPTGAYSTWTANQKNAVIPGSGEDLDGDGGYDKAMDLYDVVCFDQTKAQALRTAYPGGYNQIEGNPTAWNSAFNFDSTWGGNYNPGTVTNLEHLSGQSLGSDGLFAKKLDSLTYTNHAWAGIVDGNINGGFITRIEALAISGIINHDDRVVGGGESTAEAGCQVPQIAHMEITRWKE